jgi:hypothetical protein
MSANEIHPDEINVLIDAMKSIGGGELTRQAAQNLQKAGNTNYTIPRYVHFTMPVYKNDLKLEVQFDCELFLEAKENSFIVNLVCYKLDEIIEKTIRDLTKDVCDSCEGVKSFMV